MPLKDELDLLTPKELAHRLGRSYSWTIGLKSAMLASRQTRYAWPMGMTSYQAAFCFVTSHGFCYRAAYKMPVKNPRLPFQPSCLN